MSLVLQIALLVVSIYLVATGVELLTGRKSPDSTAAPKRGLGVVLTVLGLGIGLLGLYWMGGMPFVKKFFGA